MAKRKETAANKVFAHIVADILSGSLRPRDHISERDVVERFRVSRTPVREAIKRLYERGFLEVGPKGVAVVQEISPTDIEQLYDLRLRLESEAARQTARSIRKDEIDRLRAINKEFAKAVADRDLNQMLDVRARFHAILVTAAGNRWLAEVLIMLRDKAYMVRHAHWHDPERAKQTIYMHDEMIRMLEQKNAKRYREVVLAQIGAGLDSYMNQLVPRPSSERVKSPAA